MKEDNMSKSENIIEDLIKKTKEVESFNFTKLAKAEVLYNYMELIHLYFDNIIDPSDNLYEKINEIIVIYKTTDFINGYNLPSEIDKSMFENEINIYNLIEEEKRTGVLAKIPTMIKSKYGLRQNTVLSLNSTKDILDLKYIESTHEYIDSRYLKEQYQMGKYIIDKYISLNKGEIK